MGMQKPQFWQYEKKYLATAMVLFEYCAAFKILMREKTAQRAENFFKFLHRTRHKRKKRRIQ